MFLQRIALVPVLVVLSIMNASAIDRVVPNALLTIDQNRSTVIERIVTEWGDRLAASNAGIGAEQLREILAGLRADALLAASLAGSLDGLRDVVATSMASTAPLKPGRVVPMALGDINADLTYTPITPCRILDTRNGNAPPYNSVLVGGTAVPVSSSLPSFGPQGGSATNCGLPASLQAIAVTFTVLNPNFDAFLAAGPSNIFATLTQSVVMNFSANKGLANTAIVPVAPEQKFFVGLPLQVTTHLIADAVGYFRRPSNYVGTQVITGFAATVGGGQANTATGAASTVGGGSFNASTGESSTVGGGSSNTASVLESTVGGGSQNAASGQSSTVSGGFLNTASGSESTVGGGATNGATAASATVAGGANNFASGVGAAVGGGGFICSGGGCNQSGNVASGQSSTVPGGFGNLAGGDFSFAGGRRAKVRTPASVGGGDTDGDQGAFLWADAKDLDFNSVGPNEFAVRATGGIRLVTAVNGTTGAPTETLSIVPGGKVGINTTTPEPTATLTIKDATGPTIFLQNTVSDSVESGRIRFSEASTASNCAGGYLHYDGLTNRFSIGVHNTGDCVLANDRDVFSMSRTTGFVGVLTNPSGTDPLTVGSTTANGNGAHLTAGGIWTNGSSRTFKEGLVPVDASDVLAKVAVLPIATWRYKGASSAQHIGPMAEDFHSAFGLGDSERYIGTVDADGVALAAIQGLHQMMQQKDARLILQEREISLLKEKLQAIEAKLGL